MAFDSVFKQVLYQELYKYDGKALDRKIKQLKNIKYPKQVYPVTIERRYQRRVKELHAILKQRAEDMIEDSYLFWKEDYDQRSKADSSDIKKDEIVESLVVAIEELEDVLAEIYENDPEIRMMISQIGASVSEHQKNQWFKVTQKYVGLDLITTEQWEQIAIDLWADRNYSLIKSLPQEYIKQVNQIVSDSILQGKTKEFVLQKVKKLGKDMQGWKLKRIVRDQIGSLHGEMTKQRQTDAGFDMYIWLTAGDERVRGKPGGRYPNAVPSHYVMSGKLCRWDDPTIYSEDGGETWKKRSGKMPLVHPGYAIQCRCQALAYIDDIVDDVAEIVRQDKEAEKELFQF